MFLNTLHYLIPEKHNHTHNRANTHTHRDVQTVLPGSVGYKRAPSSGTATPPFRHISFGRWCFCFIHSCAFPYNPPKHTPARQSTPCSYVCLCWLPGYPRASGMAPRSANTEISRGESPGTPVPSGLRCAREPGGCLYSPWGPSQGSFVGTQLI